MGEEQLVAAEGGRGFGGVRARRGSGEDERAS
jgi:hypothetical protein